MAIRLGVYTHSVTVGVISFLGRKLFDSGLDAYIQTDAAISFGNSGGPLINARGQVVGITTAISAQASNIGFAVPISQVVAVLPQLREHGTVARGYIGVGLRNVTPTLRRALRLEPEEGALVEDVTPDTPAERAGLRPYDVVVGADGQSVHSDEDLTRHVSSRQPGTLTSLEVWRDGELKRVFVKLRDRPLPRTVSRRTPTDPDLRPITQPQSPLGLRVRELDEETANRLSIPDTIRGVLVADVDPTGPARLALVRTNQVILEVNRRRIDFGPGLPVGPGHTRNGSGRGAAPVRSHTARAARARRRDSRFGAMKARILVVDDEPAIRDTMRMILEYEGHEVLVAGSGQEGLTDGRARVA